MYYPGGFIYSNPYPEEKLTRLHLKENELDWVIDALILFNRKNNDLLLSKDSQHNTKMIIDLKYQIDSVQNLINTLKEIKKKNVV